MILAQALAEYGLFSAMTDSISDALVGAWEIIRHPEPLHIGIAALIVVVLWFVMGHQ
jgi:hypothetical protein